MQARLSGEISAGWKLRENTTHSRWALARALICRSISPKYFFTGNPAARTGRSLPAVAWCSRKPAFTRIEIQCRVYHTADKPVKRGHPARANAGHARRNQILRARYVIKAPLRIHRIRTMERRCFMREHTTFYGYLARAKALWIKN